MDAIWGVPTGSEEKEHWCKQWDPYVFLTPRFPIVSTADEVDLEPRPQWHFADFDDVEANQFRRRQAHWMVMEVETREYITLG